MNQNLELYESVDRCRVCNLNFEQLVLEFGMTPIADSLASLPNQESQTIPLNLYRCLPCNLLQLGSHLVPAAIFNELYPYFSSKLPSLVAHAKQMVSDLVKTENLTRQSNVIEIASNDGYLLQHFADMGIPVVGVEPCQRQAQEANRKGILTLCEFFDTNLARRLLREHSHIDLVIANNVVAHVPKINDFMEGISILIGESGTAVFEFHYALDLINEMEFDTIYHQHIFNFSLSAFASLLARHDLIPINVERNQIYGGSLRVFVKRNGVSNATVQQLLDWERSQGIFEPEFYQKFADNVWKRIDEIRQLINKLIDSGFHVAGYGAAAKASTLLSVCGLDGRHIQFIADINPHKHGLFMPNTDIEICPIERIEADCPDYLLLFAWNYSNEIMTSLQDYSKQGGRFIVPIPELKIL